MDPDEHPQDGKKREPREEDIVIPLRRPFTQLVLAALLFGGAAAFFAHRASTNDRGLILNGIIHFDPDGADVFYVVMALLSAGMSAMGAFGMWRLSRIDPFRVVIRKKSISLPSGPPVRAAESTISFRDVVGVELLPPQKPVRLAIHAAGGTHGIAANTLPEGWTLREIGDLVMERARRAQQKHGERRGAT
jgi:hypothetical protein